MESEKLIDFIINNEKGFSKNEVEKIRSEYDQIYFDEKIKEHQKKARIQKAVILALIIFYALSCVLLIAKASINNTIVNWFQGFLVGLFVVIAIYIPNLFINHSRIAQMLRMIKEIKGSKQSQL